MMQVGRAQPLLPACKFRRRKQLGPGAGWHVRCRWRTVAHAGAAVRRGLILDAPDDTPRATPPSLGPPQRVTEAAAPALWHQRNGAAGWTEGTGLIGACTTAGRP